ncbi:MULTISPECIES: colicin E3/pyocin S6 family cytotoxin [Pseudomonas]|uniref:Colicin E3/pyocin S6 family cytotoxin n=1 Tax=Pseudomonas aphyarum TaxID=2942629 RepID=A0ABT5PMF0_9PSED|nr:colicin E3/pyocin S6 family cytotoxin [Pseudomonas aphyarum]MDD0968782.1 colicin E3/pyocin S6 family cytotoxin [Pseudomonas aphyarum]MDD1124682.1 colicin E3/pyocin S6 family cytotoxin [Pseudomonas aphyarum]
MAQKSEIPRIQNPPSGDGHHITTRYMTATELAEQDARQKKYDEMQARQQAYEDRFLRQSQQPNQHSALGCVFTKSCNLPDGVINHESPAGFIPVERLADFGAFTLLGGRELDAAGNITLKRIGGAKLPSAVGTLLLGGSASIGTSTSAISSAGAVTGGVAAGALAGMVALLWPSNLGDSSLYTEEQLRSLKEGRTRIRLQVEQQPDGSLKGYGYNTQKRPDWEMIPVVQFTAQGSRQVADFGNGATLTWTPAVDSSSTSGIPPLEGAPQTPTIWIYPPTEQADKIIVNPIYPPEYEDFILVFPADSGVQPLYVVLSRPALGGDIKYHRPPRTLPAFPDAQPVKSKSSVQGGGGKRSRWKDRKGRIYEWDSKTGAIELYNKQGKHLGEFNHETGEQIDPADPERSTPK